MRVAATTTITHIRPLWDNSLLRMSVCASLPEQRTDYKCALVVCGGLVTRTEVGLRTHVECGLPKVSRVLGLCVACPEPRSAGHQGTTSRQRPSSLAQPCGLAAFDRRAPPPRATHTHASVGATCACMCARVSLCTHVCICVHARPRERTHVLTSARACPGTGAYVHTRGHASSGARTNEPNEVWSRPWITCVHTNEPILIWSRPQIMCAHMCVVSLHAYCVYATHTHVYRRVRSESGSPDPTRVHTRDRAHTYMGEAPEAAEDTRRAHVGTHM